MASKMPVDIVLPVRFPAPWFRECISSIERIADSKFQLIISVHGSPPLDLLGDPRIKYLSVVFSPESATLSEVLNSGISAGTSEFVARIDADDLIGRTRLSLQLAALNSETRIVGIGSDAIEIDEAGQSVGYRRGSGDSQRTLRQLAWRNPIIHPSMTFRRSAYEEVGGYNPKAYLAEDYDLWLRMASMGDIMSISAPLISYRIHTQQTSQQNHVSREARARIRESRLNLATSRGNSEFLAEVRHATWSLFHTFGR